MLPRLLNATVLGLALGVTATGRAAEPAQAAKPAAAKPAAAKPAPTKPTFAGRWETTYGSMELKVEGDQVSGFYLQEGVRCTITGELKQGQLHFTYREPQVTGEGTLQLSNDGQTFSGRWRERGSPRWFAWIGRRVKDAGKQGDDRFVGLWNSTYGRLRLVRRGEKIMGIYASNGGSFIEGTIKQDRFTFRYTEPESVAGEGWFELADNGQSLRGKWKQDGTSAWRDWSAQRVVAQAGIRWLVVVEARREANLAQREYSFGDMLKAFFDRAPRVQVRRRFFNDENDLRRWCREVAFLAEPVVLCIATHGTTEGIQVGGRSIPPEAIADSLRYADNVQLLHFSACLMMKQKLAGRIMQQLGSQADFPISGYATTVDWAASALIEFLYFELVLVRGMKPDRAAQQVALLFPTAGDKRVPGAVLGPAGFRLLPPPAKPTAEQPRKVEKAAAANGKKDQ